MRSIMSRVCKRIIQIPHDISLQITKTLSALHVSVTNTITTKQLVKSFKITNNIDLLQADNTLSVVSLQENKDTLALSGTINSIIASMVQGLITPFVKELEIRGVGYKAL